MSVTSSPVESLLLKPQRAASSSIHLVGLWWWAQRALAPRGDGAALRPAQRLVTALALARLDVCPMPTLPRLPSTPLLSPLGSLHDGRSKPPPLPEVLARAGPDGEAIFGLTERRNMLHTLASQRSPADAAQELVAMLDGDREGIRAAIAEALARL